MQPVWRSQCSNVSALALLRRLFLRTCRNQTIVTWLMSKTFDWNFLAHISAVCSDGSILATVTYGYNNSGTANCSGLTNAPYAKRRPSSFQYRYSSSEIMTYIIWLLEQILNKGLLQYLQKICLSSELHLSVTTALMKIPNGQRCLRCSSSRFLLHVARCNCKAYKLSGTANIWGWVLWYSWDLIDLENLIIGPNFWKSILHQYYLLIQWLRIRKTPSASFLSTTNFIFIC